MRLEDDWLGCKYIDEDGYCTRLYWQKRVEGWDMRRDIVIDKIVTV